ncbi:vertnin-like [Scleropages formosus]|uniref:Vertnin n=1 Tax=Scleropages formosus TaxID=113540 RepID=A0A0P7UB69_SCLFO|nr:vertnin [Scleropages formosus]KPP56965.1 vertnin-like [Scleropages formosus]
MIQRKEVVRFVLERLQEATECTGLDSLLRVAQEVQLALTMFRLPAAPCRQFPVGVDVDQVAHCLYPSDAPGDMIPLACEGEGNLLFDAASILLVGNTSLSLELQVRTVVEMLLWKRYYLSGMIDSKVMLQAARFSLCTDESVEMLKLPMAVLEAIFDADVKASCFLGSFANMWHVYALASVLQCRIYSIYPMYNLKIRPYFNRLIRPRALSPDSDPMILHIMWSGELESMSVFKPHHFVALVPTHNLWMGSPSAEDQGLPLKTLELLNQNPQLSYSSLKDRYNITKSTFYRWKRQTTEHRKKAAARYEAKQFLQACYNEGKLLPLHQFKEFFPDISRSTYYAWKHELQATGGSIATHSDEAGSGENFDRDSWSSTEGNLSHCNESVTNMVTSNIDKFGGDRAQILAFMQEAKKCLQSCIALNTAFPYRNFKKSFPGISRSTYYNWRREAMQANPGFKDFFGSSEDGSDADPLLHDAQWPVPSLKVCKQKHKILQLSYLQKKKLRDEAKKRAQRSKMVFAKFKLRYPSISSFFYWRWKRASNLKDKEAVTLETDWSKVSNGPEAVAIGEQNVLPSVKNTGHFNKQKLNPYNVTLSGYSVPEKHVNNKDFVMDVVALANFKARAKLFLQQRFEENSFPSFKEFSSYFPLTPRSTYYMWKRALHHGLPLVHG